MYERFFNLRERPFSLTPDPSYLYASRVHSEALSYLRYGLEGHAGFAVITGEIGSGKTTLLQTALRRLDQQTTVCRIMNTLLDAHELIEAVLLDFGLEAEQKRSKPQMLHELARFLVAERIAGRLAVLVVDEAQNLGLSALEEVRMLSNLETEKSKLIQIVLVGQPSLRDKLNTPELQQLRQRVSVSYHLKALEATDTAAYIDHRLRHASLGTPPLSFPKSVSDLVHRYSNGLPRKINVIADAILLSAYAEEQHTIDFEVAEETIADLLATHVIAPPRGRTSRARSSVALKPSTAADSAPLVIPPPEVVVAADQGGEPAAPTVSVSDRPAPQTASASREQTAPAPPAPRAAAPRSTRPRTAPASHRPAPEPAVPASAAPALPAPASTPPPLHAAKPTAARHRFVATTPLDLEIRREQEAAAREAAAFDELRPGTGTLPLPPPRRRLGVLGAVVASAAGAAVVLVGVTSMQNAPRPADRMESTTARQDVVAPPAVELSTEIPASASGSRSDAAPAPPPAAATPEAVTSPATVEPVGSSTTPSAGAERDSLQTPPPAQQAAPRVAATPPPATRGTAASSAASPVSRGSRPSDRANAVSMARATYAPPIRVTTVRPSPPVGTSGVGTTAAPPATAPSSSAGTGSTEPDPVATAAAPGASTPATAPAATESPSVVAPPAPDNAASARPSAAPAAAAVTPSPAPPVAPSPVATAPATASPVPAAAAPPSASPANSTTTAAVDRRVVEERSVRQVLNQYRSAYNRLDAAAAKTVWPSVDAKALGRAFDRLQSQEVDFARCDVSISGNRANALCGGNARFVPKVGSRSARTETRQWAFDLRKAGEQWTIATVEAR